MIPYHPFADIFPLIEGADFDDLTADIRINGLREPIVLLEGKILDGRNRYRACIAAGLMPETATAPGAGHLKYFHSFVPAGFPTPPDDGLIAFVVSKNLRRRQLNDDQRRMVAARLVNLKQGRPADDKTSQNANISRDLAAKILTSDVAGVDRARAVISRAAPELIAAVDQGVVSVASAAELASQPVERQTEIINALPRDEHGKLTPAAKKALKPVIKEIRAEQQTEKKDRRDAREADLGKKQSALPSKKYGVILADPEWSFEVYSRDTGMDRAADNHYPTSTTDAICTRPVADIAADDCVLFMWATVPMLPDALRVMAAWGFEYKSHAIWLKDKVGTGYWFRNQHELLLVGTRGKIPAPAMGTQLPSVFHAAVGRHSQKPDAVYEMIELYFPTLPKIELNARSAREGWQCWGNEAPSAEDEAA